jgi:hypothetical protein
MFPAAPLNRHSRVPNGAARSVRESLDDLRAGGDHTRSLDPDGFARSDRLPERRLKAGTVLARQYQGERHTVTMVSGDYVCREGTYASLSTNARPSPARPGTGRASSGCAIQRDESEGDPDGDGGTSLVWVPAPEPCEFPFRKNFKYRLKGITYKSLTEIDPSRKSARLARRDLKSSERTAGEMTRPAA